MQVGMALRKGYYLHHYFSHLMNARTCFSHKLIVQYSSAKITIKDALANNFSSTTPNNQSISSFNQTSSKPTSSISIQKGADTHITNENLSEIEVVSKSPKRVQWVIFEQIELCNARIQQIQGLAFIKHISQYNEAMTTGAETEDLSQFPLIKLIHIGLKYCNSEELPGESVLDDLQNSIRMQMHRCSMEDFMKLLYLINKLYAKYQFQWQFIVGVAIALKKQINLMSDEQLKVFYYLASLFSTNSNLKVNKDIFFTIQQQIIHRVVQYYDQSEKQPIQPKHKIYQINQSNSKGKPANEGNQKGKKNKLSHLSISKMTHLYGWIAFSLCLSKVNRYDPIFLDKKIIKLLTILNNFYKNLNPNFIDVGRMGSKEFMFLFRMRYILEDLMKYTAKKSISLNKFQINVNQEAKEAEGERLDVVEWMQQFKSNLITSHRRQLMTILDDKDKEDNYSKLIIFDTLLGCEQFHYLNQYLGLNFIEKEKSKSKEAQVQTSKEAQAQRQTQKDLPHPSLHELNDHSSSQPYLHLMKYSEQLLHLKENEGNPMKSVSCLTLKLKILYKLINHHLLDIQRAKFITTNIIHQYKAIQLPLNQNTYNLLAFVHSIIKIQLIFHFHPETSTKDQSIQTLQWRLFLESIIIDYLGSLTETYRHFDWFSHCYLMILKQKYCNKRFQRQLTNQKGVVSNNSEIVNKQKESDIVNKQKESFQSNLDDELDDKIKKMSLLMKKIEQESSYYNWTKHANQEINLLKQKEEVHALFKFFTEIQVHDMLPYQIILQPFTRLAHFANSQQKVVVNIYKLKQLATRAVLLQKKMLNLHGWVVVHLEANSFISLQMNQKISTISTEVEKQRKILLKERRADEIGKQIVVELFDV